MILSGCSTLNDSGFKATALETTPEKKSDRIVVVPLFENATFEPILEKPLTQIFKETLYGNGWEVQNQSGVSSKVLIGRITHFAQSPIALDAVGRAREYRLAIGLTVALLEEKNGETLFSMRLEGLADYVTRADAVSNRIAKDRAIREAGRGMAEKVLASLQIAADKQEKASSD